MEHFRRIWIVILCQVSYYVTLKLKSVEGNTKKRPHFLFSSIKFTRKGYSLENICFVWYPVYISEIFLEVRTIYFLSPYLKSSFPRRAILSKPSNLFSPILKFSYIQIFLESLTSLQTRKSIKDDSKPSFTYYKQYTLPTL